MPSALKTAQHSPDGHARCTVAPGGVSSTASRTSTDTPIASPSSTITPSSGDPVAQEQHRAVGRQPARLPSRRRPASEQPVHRNRDPGTPGMQEADRDTLCGPTTATNVDMRRPFGVRPRLSGRRDRPAPATCTERTRGLRIDVEDRHRRARGRNDQMWREETPRNLIPDARGSPGSAPARPFRGAACRLRCPGLASRRRTVVGVTWARGERPVAASARSSTEARRPFGGREEVTMEVYHRHRCRAPLEEREARAAAGGAKLDHCPET